MHDFKAAFRAFVEYHAKLSGDEKGEAQVYCDRFFRALGHEGYKEAGAMLEARVRKGKDKRVSFADLLWPGRLLLEMKSRGEKLEQHYQQAFEYWMYIVPDRPRYVVLSNFDEWWVYDFNQQLHEPMGTVKTSDLPEQYEIFGFLFPEPEKPDFDNDRVDVTRKAADRVAKVFRSLVARNIRREQAQRYILQCVVALFAEDIDLLPHKLFTHILADCVHHQASSYDLIGSLFRQMNNPKPAPGGRYKGVNYFNGGLFADVDPVELEIGEAMDLLAAATGERWSRVKPEIFGTLFEHSMGAEERHAMGAHFTSEADIQKVVLPTIVRPWREQIESANKFADLIEIRDRMLNFHVLDPACGSGNFLYVAYRELKRLEVGLIRKVHETFSRRVQEKVGATSHVSAGQFHGFDVQPFAVELAKVTLMIGKKLALDESLAAIPNVQRELQFDVREDALPLDNLDANIRCEDALFADWPHVDAIIGNPPFQSKNKMLQELGEPYVRRVRKQYPGVPGRADYCVYWFRRAHDELPPCGRAGLVGTNTIRQNYSRQGGLDYIVGNGGTITEAVSTQVWSGDAVVHVSIVNWIKGDRPGPKRLSFQIGDSVDSPWEAVELERINSALSASVDLSLAKSLHANSESQACYQGQTHGNEGFLLTAAQATAMRADRRAAPVVHPYLTADELFSGAKAWRYSIDLNRCDDLLAAKAHGPAFVHVERSVLPGVRANAEEEREKSGRKTGPRQSHLQNWWKFWRGRIEMLDAIAGLTRYIVCGQVTKRPIFEFLSPDIRPNAALIVFPRADDYTFGILQSRIHWAWFVARCSTLKGDFRYTSNSVFDSFPWPQDPTLAQTRAVAKAAVALRAIRNAAMRGSEWNLRELYRTLEQPGENRLREAHDNLDAAVRTAYGMKARQDILTFLLDLNGELAAREESGKKIVPPGLPPCVTNPKPFITTDCIQPPKL